MLFIYNYTKKDGTTRPMLVDETKSKPIISIKYHTQEDKHKWLNCKTTTETVCTHILVWDNIKKGWRKLILSSIKDRFEANSYCMHYRILEGLHGQKQDTLKAILTA
jgi:hypothetical protein